MLQYINSLKHDKNFLEQLKKGALRTATYWLGWEESSEKFYGLVNDFKETTTESKAVLQKRTARLYGALGEAIGKMGVEPQIERVEKAVQLINARQLKLVIYGAGAATRGLIPFLDEYKVSVVGIAVSNIKDNPHAIFGNKVSLITDFLEKKEEILVYIATDKYRKEIEGILQEYGFTNIM